MITWPRVMSKKRATSATYSLPLLPSHGSLPFRPNCPRCPMAHIERTSATMVPPGVAFRERPYRSMAFWQRVVHKTHLMSSRHLIHKDAHPHRRIEAIGLMALATICFAGLDSTAKYLVGIKGVPVAEVSWFRFAGHAAFTALVLS